MANAPSWIYGGKMTKVTVAKQTKATRSETIKVAANKRKMKENRNRNHIVHSSWNINCTFHAQIIRSVKDNECVDMDLDSSILLRWQQQFKCKWHGHNTARKKTEREKERGRSRGKKMHALVIKANIYGQAKRTWVLVWYTAWLSSFFSTLFYTLFLLHFFLHTRSSHNRIFLRICW